MSQAPSSTAQVFEAVKDLRALEQHATRESVAELTGLKMSVVDDRLRHLVAEGMLKRLVRGFYELAEQYPQSRPIFFGLLADGSVKLEIGDDVLTLTPQEARRLARIMGGLADDARVIDSTREHLIVATELMSRVERLERQRKS